MILTAKENTILVLVIGLMLLCTLAALVRLSRHHRKQFLKLQKQLVAAEEQYEEQSRIIIGTIQKSQPVIVRLHESIGRIETLARGTSANAEIRHEAEALRNTVAGLEDLILVQNIEEGLNVLHSRDIGRE
jgi:uncharacterized membrane-anchored protein YhcB (DUF1043 family)